MLTRPTSRKCCRGTFIGVECLAFNHDWKLASKVAWLRKMTLCMFLILVAGCGLRVAGGGLSVMVGGSNWLAFCSHVVSLLATVTFLSWRHLGLLSLIFNIVR